MAKHVLFILGGGSGDDYSVDAKLVASLQTALGEDYLVHYPFLPSDEKLPDFGRKKQIGKQLSLLAGEVFLVGHSLGASMLLQYLSQEQVNNEIAGLFLLSTPNWSGDEDWKQGLKLREDFAARLPQDVPIFLYHCADDEEVPVDQLEFYKQQLPKATVRTNKSGGHQFNDDLSMMAGDIKSL